MTTQKIYIRIRYSSSIRLGKGSYVQPMNKPYILQTVQSQNRFEEVAVALYKSYKTS